MIRKASIAFAATCLLALSLSVQDKKQKPWTEWSKKDVERILNNSPWGQTQTTTDTSEMFYSPTSTPTTRSTSTSSQRSADGATNQATDIKYHIRFFSARPIRQALARMIILNNQPSKEIEERLKNFAELQSNDSIIITVTFESQDGRYSGSAMQSFNGATTASLKNSTYLERNDGKRIFLEDYVLPGKDGFGARFIFPREVNSQPFLDADVNEVRFVSDIASGLNMRFKLTQMKYNDTLEY